ncbi:MAG: hypothetical protein R3300_19255 [Candidatus Promineifilaceae bacterium]|nr:hypothetical protein [Candidatus Promineifilaceae bacterium]
MVLLRTALPSISTKFRERFASGKELGARLSRAEALGLAIAAGALVISLAIYEWLPITPNDYKAYTNTARGFFDGFYYAYWILPAFQVLDRLPFVVGYGLLNLLNILGVLFAARVFGGRGGLALLSFQMLYVILLGSITGILVGALALAWWGLNRERWLVAGIGLALAGIKPQLGGTLGLILWLLAPGTARDKVNSLIVPTFVAVASLIAYPGWPAELLSRLLTSPPNQWGSITLWDWIGPAALLLWLPPLLLPMRPSRRFVALVAANALALPYFQQTDLLALFTVVNGWLPAVLGNLGYLFFAFKFDAFELLVVIPAIVYGAALAPSARRWWQRDHRLGINAERSPLAFMMKDGPTDNER